MPLAPGTKIGPLEIVAPLGAGGMGEVYLARDARLNRDVAIKVLREGAGLDSDRVAQFRQEAQTLATLNHPNIGAIYGLEESNGIQGLVLELVEGSTLAERIEQGALPVAEALAIATQICDALSTAHQRGIVHRDLKPANIKITPTGRVKVLDFGLAKLTIADGNADLSQRATLMLSDTRDGVLVGTLAYMSPEQARGQSVDQRSDIWSFGCVLFEMLSGHPVFGADTISDTIASVIDREPDWRVLPTSTPAPLRHLLRHCLQKDRSARIPTIAAVAAEIETARAAGNVPRGKTVAAVVTGATIALALIAGSVGYLRKPTPSPRSVSVLVADFDNRTADPEFDQVLEPLLKLALEDAPFVTAFDRSQIRSRLGVQVPDTFDAPAALEVATAHGLGVIVTGAIRGDPGGYVLSAKLTKASDQTEVAAISESAATKSQVPAALAMLSYGIRLALGDDEPSTTHRGTQSEYPAFESAREFSMGSQALGAGKYEEALKSFAKATAIDPNNGLAYTAMALASRNLDRRQDAERYITEALRHLDSMSERERYKTRGVFYYFTADYDACVKEYSELSARYPAEASSRNQFALCLTYLREFRRAMAEMEELTKIMPKRVVYRENLALYADYAGDFEAAERAVAALAEPSLFSQLALAFAQLLQGRTGDVTQTYHRIAKFGDQGASYAASGLGDLALYEGRLSDAVRIFTEGAAADMAARDSDRAAYKFAALAHVETLRQRPDSAIAAAERSLAVSTAVPIRFLAGRAFAAAGNAIRAKGVSATLAADLQPEPRAYAKIVDAEIALTTNNPREAIQLLTDANNHLDTWLGHFMLGRAYLEVSAFTQADSEFERCFQRRGEALALFLDEEPTFGYFPVLYYYQGRTREGLKTERFADAYRSYLAIREKPGEDPLLEDVRRRAGR